FLPCRPTACRLRPVLSPVETIRMDASDPAPSERIDLGRPWHALPADAVLRALETDANGLGEAEAAERRQRFGDNALPEPRRASLPEVYIKQFRSPLIYLLLAAAAVAVALGDLADAAFIFIVLQINAVIGTIQEWKAETGAAALRAQVQSVATVRRAGGIRPIDSVELVPG